jgi:sugar fermentation stimulation protein A
LLYLVQRTDCTAFSVAGDIDPTYAAAFAVARAAGLETLVIGTHISPHQVTLGTELPLKG